MEIKCEIFRGKRWFKANDIIKLLGFNGRINTSNYVKNNIPIENRTQLSGRETWYIDEIGMSILLLKGKTKISVSLRDIAHEFIGEVLKSYADSNTNFDGFIPMNPNEKIKTTKELEFAK